MDTSTDNNAHKKDPFENLSKEELIKKCKHLLGIAQKAKQVKDDLTEENKSLKNALSKLEIKSSSDITTMQEMLNSMTEQKLIMVTENDTLKKKIHTLENKIKEFENDKNNLNNKYQSLDTENQSLNRQVKRLSEENDHLLSHLDTLEKQIDELNRIGEQQREQLLILEEQNSSIKIDDNESQTNIQVLSDENLKLKQLCDKLTLELEENKRKEPINDQQNVDSDFYENEIKKLQNQLITLEEKLLESSKCLNSAATELSETKNELELMKTLKEKYNEKLKLYHSKLIKVFSDIKELKQCKCNLLLVIEEYSKHVNQWSKEIEHVSKKYTEELLNSQGNIQKLHKENTELTKINYELTNECQILKNQLLSAHLIDNKVTDKSETNMVETKNKIDNNVEELTELSNTRQLSEENILLKEEIKNYIQTIEEYQFKKNAIELKKNKLIEETKVNKSELENNENIKLEIESLETELNHLLEVINSNKSELNKLKRINHERKLLVQENKNLKQKLKQLDNIKTELLTFVNKINNSAENEKCDSTKENLIDLEFLKNTIEKMILDNNSESSESSESKKMKEKHEDEKNEFQENMTSEQQQVTLDIETIEQLMQDLQTQNTNLNEIMTTHKENTVSYDKLSKINADLECQYSKLKIIIERYNIELKSQLNLKTMYEKMNNENVLLKNELKNIIQDFQKIMNTETYDNSQTEDKHMLIRHLEKYKQRFEDISSLQPIKIDNNYKETKDLSNELNANNQLEIEMLHEKLKEKERELEVLKEMENNKEKLQLELNEHKTIINELNNKIETDKNTSEKIISKIQNEYDNLKLENNQLNQKYIELDTLIQNLNENKRDLENHLTEKDNNILNFIKTLEETDNKYKNNLEKLETELKNEITLKNDIETKYSLISQEKTSLDIKVSELETQLKENHNKLNEIKKELENKNKENHNLKNLQKESENNDQKLKDFINELTKDKEDLIKRNQDLFKNLQNSEGHINELRSKIEQDNLELTETNKRLIKENNSLLEENTNLNTKIKDIENELENINTKYSDLENKYKAYKEIEKTEINTEINQLKKVINDLQIEKDVSSKLIEELTSEQTNLKTVNEKLEEKLNSLENEIKNYQQDISDLKHQLTISKRENAELLREMNDMNQAIKERGETISKQKEYAQELLKKLQTSEQEIEQTKHQSEKLEEKLKLQTEKHDSNQQEELIKDEKIKKLEQEIQQLRDTLHSTSRDQDGCGDSEVMSTSTVSRLDESARLKDLEGSWEERYTKLRTLALKLKGKVKELTEQLNQEKTERIEAQSKAASSLKNIQTMQTQYDKLHDDHDKLSADNRNYVKKIDNLMTDNEKLTDTIKINNENIDKMKLEMEAFKKGKEGGDSAIKKFISQIQGLKKEIESQSITNKELENQITKLKSEIESKNDELQKEIKAHEETKKNLETLNKECKKKSVLSLEMEDYEKTLKEKVQELEKKNESIAELKKKLSHENDVLNSVKEQTHLLEDRIMQEERNSKELELKLMEGAKKLNEAELIISQKENKIKETVKKLENITASNEELNTQIAQLISQHQKQVDTLRSEKEYFKSQVLGLEEKARDLTMLLKERQEELKQVQNEFNSYKVRAQSVLKQNNTRDVGLEERLNEEVNTLHTQINTLNSELNSTTKKLEDLKLQNETNESEKSKLTTRINELETLLKNEKDENVSFNERLQRMITEHKEELRVQKIHTETLIQCYKQQLSEQLEQYTKEIAELKSQKQVVQDEYIETNFSRRDDGEGTESIDSASNTSQTKKLVGLEKLLSMNADLSATTQDTELIECKEKLATQEARVSHLTDLLADAEQDLAKYIHQNQMLKEEIRRQERSVEREKHAENLEYMKNVIIKFITLPSNDEKSRLVPVLTTILKLSPEEVQKLNTITKGVDPTGRGWGSYLPIWPGGNNSQ